MSNLRTLAAILAVAAVIAAAIAAAIINGAADSWVGPALLTLVQPLLIGAVVAIVADVAVDEIRKP